jgi:DNA-binding LytR/AlgR family response regulator
MATAKVLIVEDEILIASYTKQCIINHGYLCVGIAISYANAIDFLERNEVDVVLLDVNISGDKSGIDLATLINEKYNIPFIYLTSYSDPKTIESLKETFPAAYLSKPINKTMLTTALDILWANKKRKENNYFKFSIGNTHYTIDLDELLLVKSDHVYVELIFKTKKIILRSSLKNMANLLPAGTMKQVNRSTLVNPLFIKKIKGTQIEIGNEILKISKIFKAEFEENT